MLQIDHRESHDVDLFLDDPQLMPYLNPETQGFDLSIRPSSYTSDGTQSLKIVFDEVGEIDVICCGWLTDDYSINREINGHPTLLEKPSEIIAKKVFYRGWSLQARDMFDIAAVRQVYGDDYVVEALSPFPKQVALAQSVAERLNRDLALGILSGLTVRGAFSELIGFAQTSTIEILSKVSK
ncbi:hypothetical protein SAMN04488041_101366 [Sulfitobacter pontiacus]|uniref:Nucleotidyl transferase AbiEii toxin, Type IV TA system n=2 Tax=Sulfitobacter pontiacus TaxID=60137 RepID=A0A1H2R1R0_9RHOB|nr:hypothetical protein SAMN04488041_101366 [Sulfitobacter pontiacus]